MRMKKSQLKEAVKMVVRQCLNERVKTQEDCGSKFKRMAKHVAASERELGKSPEKAKQIGYATANKAKTDEGTSAKTQTQTYRVAPNPSVLTQKTDDEKLKPKDPRLTEKMNTLPPNKGQFKTVAPHQYTDVAQNKALTIQTDPEVSEQVGADVVADEGADSKIAPIDDIVKFVINRAPALHGKPEQIALVAGELFKHQYGGREADPEALHQAVQRALPVTQTDMNKGSEQDECGSMEDECGGMEEGGDNWIQGAVKHPGRCAHMGSPQCPEGSPQYNLAKRFKSGDIHKANTTEAGLTSEEPMTEEPPMEDPNMQEPQPFAGAEPAAEPPVEPAGQGQEHDYDERLEIKMIKLMKLLATKLERMHKGMPGDEEPVSLPPEVDEEPPVKDKFPSEPAASEEPSEPSSEEPASDEEPAEKPEPKGPPKKKEKDSSEKSDKPEKKKKKKKEEDPTEFTKKLAKENHRVQARSYVTVKDNPNDPNKMRDPENPQSNGA